MNGVGNIRSIHATVHDKLKGELKYIVLSLPPERTPSRKEVDESFFTEENDFTDKNIKNIKTLNKGEVCNASNGTHFISRIVFIKGDNQAIKYVEEYGWGWIK